MSSLHKYSGIQTVTWLIRFILIGTALFLLSRIFLDIVAGDDSADDGTVDFELLYQSCIVLGLSFIPDYIERRHHVLLPRILSLGVVLFIFATVFLGDGLGLYGRFWWWDDLAHTISGVAVGFIGFFLVSYLNIKYKMRIRPILIAGFAFCIAVTVGVLWEVFEFTIDVFLGTASQKWGLPPDTIMMGQSYQGSGLRDTMSDLIVSGIGSLIASVYLLNFYNNNVNKVKEIIRRVFPGDAV